MASRISIVSRQAGLPPQFRTAATKPKAGSTATREQVAVGWVRLQPDEHPELTVLCELTNAPDIDTDTGWTEIERARTKNLSRWTSRPSVGAPFALYLDAVDNDRADINNLYDNLEALAGRGRRARNTVNDAYQPPAFTIDTAGVFRSDASVFPELRWIITGLDWDEDEAETDDATGDRLRAACTMTVREHTVADRLQSVSLDNAKRLQARAKKSKSYTVQTGDTLISIARRRLGDASRWEEIADLNNIRDPDAVKPGARIRLP